MAGSDVSCGVSSEVGCDDCRGGTSSAGAAPALQELGEGGDLGLGRRDLDLGEEVEGVGLGPGAADSGDLGRDLVRAGGAALSGTAPSGHSIVPSIFPVSSDTIDMSVLG